MTAHQKLCLTRHLKVVIGQYGEAIDRWAASQTPNAREARLLRSARHEAQKMLEMVQGLRTKG
jgi:hypothetical protein